MERTARERELEQRIADLEREVAAYHMDGIAYEREKSEYLAQRAEVIRLLTLAADGRREYARGSEGAMLNLDTRQVLLAEAQYLDNARKIVEGDKDPLYGLLPSWMWAEAGLE